MTTQQQQLRPKFVYPTKLSKHLQCIICLDYFIDPTRISCGHTFCKGCLEESLRMNQNCPFCRTPIDLRLVSKDLIAAKILNDQLVYCYKKDANSCLWQGPLQQLEAHDKMCKEAPDWVKNFDDKNNQVKQTAMEMLNDDEYVQEAIESYVPGSLMSRLYAKKQNQTLICSLQVPLTKSINDASSQNQKYSSPMIKSQSLIDEYLEDFPGSPIDQKQFVDYEDSEEKKMESLQTRSQTIHEVKDQQLEIINNISPEQQTQDTLENISIPVPQREDSKETIPATINQKSQDQILNSEASSSQRSGQTSIGAEGNQKQKRVNKGTGNSQGGQQLLKTSE